MPLDCLFGNLEAVDGTQITFHRIQVTALVLHVACVVLHIDHLAAEIHCHEAVRS